MANGARGDKAPTGDDPDGLADDHTVEIDHVARRQVGNCNLVFDGDVVDHGTRSIAEAYDCAASQRFEGNYDVVAWIDLQDGVDHVSCRLSGVPAKNTASESPQNIQNVHYHRTFVRLLIRE